MSQKRVAIIGSGIAGLTAGWMLSGKYHVTLLEKGNSLGMGQFGVDAGTQKDAVVDVPLRVFNKSYYPNLFKMCRNLGIDLRFVDHGGAFGRLNGDLYFKYDNLSLGKKNYSYVLPKLKQLPWLFSVGIEILKLKRDMPKFLRREDKDSITLSDFFESYGYSRAFQFEFFLPILATVCTCSYTALLDYPAGIIIEGMLTLMEATPTQRFVGGTRALQEKLADSIQEIRYECHVQKVKETEVGIKIIFADESSETYDHVIFATQANQAKDLLGPEFKTEKALLERVPYQQSDMVVHRDARLMPQSSSWPPVYYGINGRDWPMATIWINKVEPGFQEGEDLFQTWNPLIEPEPGKVLGRTTFERPIVSRDSMNAMASLSKLQEREVKSRRVWFCGSYATRAIPLLESGLVSAIEIGENLGLEAPSWFEKV